MKDKDHKDTVKMVLTPEDGDTFGYVPPNIEKRGYVPPENLAQPVEPTPPPSDSDQSSEDESDE